MNKKDIRNLGANFGTSFLLNRLAGKDTRTAFRHAGIGTVTEKSITDFGVDKEIADFTAAAIENLAQERKVEIGLHLPEPIESVETHRPSREQYEEAQKSVDAALRPTKSQLRGAIREMEEFVEWLEEAIYTINAYLDFQEEVEEDLTSEYEA